MGTERIRAVRSPDRLGWRCVVRAARRWTRRIDAPVFDNVYGTRSIGDGLGRGSELGPHLRYCRQPALILNPGRNMGIVRSDIAEVTFGHPFRSARMAGSILVVRYDSGVIHANDLWNGTLLSIPLDGGDPDEVVSFRRDLPGAELRSGAVLLVSVPLWDACPDGRVAVLDPIARILFLISPADGHKEAITLPWEPTKLDAGTRRSYMSARIAAEADRQLTAVELEQITNEALNRAAELFARDEPLGVDIRCGPGNVWIQAFDRDGDFMGYGSRWLRISLAGEPGAIVRVRFPSGFKPHRFSASHAIGVLSDPVGLQDVAVVALPPALTTARTPSTSVPNTTRRQGEPNT